MDEPITDHRMPRVLQLFNRYRERGGEEQSAERIFHHASAVCEIDRLWWDSRVWDQPGAPGKLGQLRSMFCNEQSAAEVRKRIGSYRPNALLCHNLYPVASPSVYREALRAGVPVIQYVHNFRPFSVGGALWAGDRVAVESLRGRYWSEVRAGAWQDSIVKSAMFAVMLKRLHASGWLEAVKCWICVSEFMMEQFLRAGVPEGRLVMLRHSWDRKAAEPRERDGGYYLFLSRLVREKGVSVLLEAWEIICQEMGDAAPMLKVGGVGPEEQRVRAAAARNEQIKYVGFVDGRKKSTLIAECRAMLAPSLWWEPLGLVTYEAYEYSKPMLAAASGGLTETVENGVTGFLYPPNNSRALADKVMCLEKMSREDRGALGAAGLRWLSRETESSRWSEKFESIVKKVVNP